MKVNRVSGRVLAGPCEPVYVYEAPFRLWNRLGFATVGRLPGAFRHPSRGYVDALVMYKWLER